MEREPLLELPFEDVVHIVEAMDVQSILLLCATSRAYRELCSNPIIAQIIDRKQRESKIVAKLDSLHPGREHATNLMLYFPESSFLQEIFFEFELTHEIALFASQQLMNIGEDEDLGNDLFLAEDLSELKIEEFSDNETVYVTLNINNEHLDMPGTMTYGFKTKPFVRFLAEYGNGGILTTTILRENGFVESYDL